MIRLFIALPLPAFVRDQLARLGGGIQGASWTDPDTLHLTLRFIGEVDTPTAQELDAALAEITQAAFPLSLAGVGQFDTGGRSRTLWAGVERSAGLIHLRGKIERACAAVGLAPEARRFTPHVTLARLDHAPLDRVMRFLGENALFRAPPVTIDGFTLFESIRTQGGPHYSPLATYDFTAADSVDADADDALG